MSMSMSIRTSRGIVFVGMSVLGIWSVARIVMYVFWAPCFASAFFSRSYLVVSLASVLADGCVGYSASANGSISSAWVSASRRGGRRSGTVRSVGSGWGLGRRGRGLVRAGLVGRKEGGRSEVWCGLKGEGGTGKEALVALGRDGVWCGGMDLVGIGLFCEENSVLLLWEWRGSS